VFTPDYGDFFLILFFNFVGVSGPFIIRKRTYPKFDTGSHR
jgi:hypothetical protein